MSRSSSMLTSLRSLVVSGLLTVAPAAVCAQTPAGQPPAQPSAQQLREEVERLRAEFEAVRDSYGARLADLEARLKGVEAGQPVQPGAAPPAGVPATPPAATPTAPTDVQVPPGATGAGGPTGSLPFYGGSSALSKIFNPDIAVIGNFLGAAGHNESPDAPPALDLDEVEATFQAVVDPYARADFFLAFSPEGAEIEEGFITFPTLPAGLLMKVGKMRGSFGRVNQMHTHVMPWTDRPLLTTNLLGGDEGISNAGVSLSRLLHNPVAFLEATGEVYRGDDEVFSTPERDDLQIRHKIGYYAPRPDRLPGTSPAGR